MSATLYESAQDEIREDAIAEQIARTWGLERQTKAPRLARYDREFWKGGKIYFLGEIKSRTTERGRWPFYMIDAAKIAELIHVSRATQIPGMLFVQFTDGLFCVPVEPRLLEWTKQGGRLDRDDALDIETCCFFPVTYFGRVKK